MLVAIFFKPHRIDFIKCEKLSCTDNTLELTKNIKKENNNINKKKTKNHIHIYNIYTSQTRYETNCF